MPEAFPAVFPAVPTPAQLQVTPEQVMQPHTEALRTKGGAELSSLMVWEPDISTSRGWQRKQPFGTVFIGIILLS